MWFNTTQKTKDWATRTTLKTNNKQHKILHIKLKIGQHEPHYETNDKQHKILHKKIKIGQHGSILCCLLLVFSVVRVAQSLVFCVVFGVVYRWFFVWFVLSNLSFSV
jgi:hypothetical protein